MSLPAWEPWLQTRNASAHGWTSHTAVELQVDLRVERVFKAVVAKTSAPVSKDKATLKMCSCYLSNLTAEGCRNRDQRKFRHERTSGKCLPCGSEYHNLQYDRPGRRLNTKQGEGKPTLHALRLSHLPKAGQQKGRAEAKTRRRLRPRLVRLTSWVRSKTTLLTCEAVAKFAVSDDLFGDIADWDASHASDCKLCARAHVACDSGSTNL